MNRKMSKKERDKARQEYVSSVPISEVKLPNGVVLKGKEVTPERIKADVEKMELIMKKYKSKEQEEETSKQDNSSSSHDK